MKVGGYSDIVEFPLCIMEFSTFRDNSQRTQDTMKCFTNVGLVYECLGESTITEKKFRKEMAKMSMKNAPYKIPPYIYKELEEYRVYSDDEITVLYSEKGIGGILELLSVKQIYDWDKKDHARFMYIASLCWNHEIFFEWDMSNDAPVTRWYIYGNDDLLKKYYHPVVPEEWHELFPKQN